MSYPVVVSGHVFDYSFMGWVLGWVDNHLQPVQSHSNMKLDKQWVHLLCHVFYSISVDYRILGFAFICQRKSLAPSIRSPQGHLAVSKFRVLPAVRVFLLQNQRTVKGWTCNSHMTWALDFKAIRPVGREGALQWVRPQAETLVSCWLDQVGKCLQLLETQFPHL